MLDQAILLDCAEETIKSFSASRVPLQLAVKAYRERLSKLVSLEIELDELVNTTIHHMPLVICTLALKDMIISTTHMYLCKYLSTCVPDKDFSAFLKNFLGLISDKLRDSENKFTNNRVYREVIRMQKNNTSGTYTVYFPNLPTFLAIKYFLRSYWINQFSDTVPKDWQITGMSEVEHDWLNHITLYKDVNTLLNPYKVVRSQNIVLETAKLPYQIVEPAKQQQLLVMQEQ